MFRSFKKKIIKSTNLDGIIHWKNLDQTFFKRKILVNKIYKIFSGRVCSPK